MLGVKLNKMELRGIVGLESKIKVLAHQYLIIRKAIQGLSLMSKHLEKNGYPVEIAEPYRRMLVEVRKALEREMNGLVINHPAYYKYLQYLDGIGPTISALIIGLIQPRRFATISKMWKYLGLTPESRRQKGENAGYNVKAKTVVYTAVSNMLMKGSIYKKIYENFKAEEREKHPELRRAHIHMRAMRKTMKLFTAHYWTAYRRILGLPVSKPYAHAILGHKDYVDVLVDKPKPGIWRG